MYRHLLVPIDGGPFSAEMISQSVSFAKALGAELTFFHAVPDESASLRSDAALLHTMAPDRFAVSYTQRAPAVLSKAQAEAEARGVPSRTLGVASDRVAEAILEAAAQRGCDLIFLSTSGRAGKMPMMLGSVALDVLARAVVPVLVTNFRTARTPVCKVLAVIKDEHDSLAVVLRGFRHHLDEARGRGARPDLALVRSILLYLRAFPQALHHPKEESHLFRALRRRTNEVDATIAELQRQHAVEAELLREVEAALPALEGDATSDAEALARAARALDTHVTAHIALEETIILPAAIRHLHDADWEAIDDAFSGNGDPNFAASFGEDFQSLFARLVGLFPPPPFA
ncbi:universal stress protein [Azospirillum sp.]|uniref:universal stress protein n=1 Tax=Azospirillum sp. TaxID=34012 RepID=UPI002D458703|nr:universal stress protein [Azospirillum sp.]HYD71117.1 universal stress protein [Azospirillum sp.]